MAQLRSKEKLLAETQSRLAATEAALEGLRSEFSTLQAHTEASDTMKDRVLCVSYRGRRSRLTPLQARSRQRQEAERSALL